MRKAERFYMVYADDSGNEATGVNWTALAFPAEYWSSYLRSWLEFRKTLNKQHEIPASFELHALNWLATKPLNRYERDIINTLEKALGYTPDILKKNRESRKTRSQVFENALKTIGSWEELRVMSVFSEDSSGEARIALYDDLICSVEHFLEREDALGTFVVDGVHDSGGHMRSAHRALILKKRRLVEDAGLRDSVPAFQSIRANPERDEKFAKLYERALNKVIERPMDAPQEGRCIRGCDYAVEPHEDCPSENIVARLVA